MHLFCQVELHRSLNFEKRKDKLVGDAADVLTQVATALGAIELVADRHDLPLLRFEVAGHTNAALANRGTAFQMTLSENRAKVRLLL